MAPLERVRAGLAWSWCRGGGQGVGRAIRLADDKTVGTIVIPVFLGSSDDHEVILDDSTFKTVWDVVRVTIGGKEMNRFGSPPTIYLEANVRVAVAIHSCPSISQCKMSGGGV